MCQLRSVRRSLLQSLVTNLVLTRLDGGNATVASIRLYLLKRLHSVILLLGCSHRRGSRRCHTPLLR